MEFSGTIGGRLFKEKMSGTSEDDCRQIITDVLGIKSPKTAIKSADCLRRFINWLVTKNCKPWPFYSGRVLAYLNECTKKKPAATAGLTLMEAFKFAHHVMGIEIGLDIINDPQLVGKVKRMALFKPEIKQARPLLCAEVEQMEKFMVTSTSVEDVYFVGCWLFALYARARWSDIRYIHKAQLDKSELDGGVYGFFECTTKYVKTSTSVERKARFMPMVCPLVGITGTDWTTPWLGAMASLGLNIDKVPVGSLCRAIKSSGELAVRHLTTGEVTDLLNHFFKTTEANRLSSHSLKETTLSWSAKYGIDEDSRTLLGHHELSSKGKSKSLATYSRDMLSRPLMFYCQMLASIRSKDFQPDLSRPGWMRHLPHFNMTKACAEEGVNEEKSDRAEAPVGGVGDAGTPLTTVAQPGTNSDEHGAKEVQSDEKAVESVRDDGGVEADVESSDIESASSSSSSSTDLDQLGEAPTGKLAAKDRQIEIPGPLFQNPKSGVLHKPGSNSSMFRWARCGRCFKGEVIASPSQAADVLEAMSKRRRAT